MPLTFSIIIPTFNRAHIIHRAIECLLIQKFKDFELIIVDDGSSDNLKEVVQIYLKDSSIKYYYQANKGVCAARNFGVTQATGDYLIFLDSDDLLNEDALTTYNNVIQNKKFDIIYGDMISKNSITNTSKYVSAQNPYNNGKGVGVYIPGAFSISRHFFNKIGGYDEKINYGENTELKFRINYNNPKIAFTKKETLIYEASTDGGSKNLKNIINANMYIIQKHPESFKKNPKVLQLYWQNIAIAQIRLNHFNQAKKNIIKSWISYPRSFNTFIRMVIIQFQFLSKIIWRP